ncbi:hypothetical protein KQI84_18905 [bacterium]|nr:hypothetical protein [bacterium]
MLPESRCEFPLWIERSGLPREMNETAKSPHAYFVFRKIVELDCERNSTPGTVEISLLELEELTGIPADQLRKTLKKIRKCAVLRAFVPDNDEEPGLFQVIAPLSTPKSWEKVRQEQIRLRNLAVEEFRYALAAEDLPAPDGDKPDPKLKAVIDEYFNTVSMKMNAFILDELRLIAARYPLDLIKKVFARARKEEKQSLGWILTQIRREETIRQKVTAKRSDQPPS